MTDLGTRLLIGERVEAQEIWFAHPPQAKLSHYRHRFEANIYFDAPADAIFFRADDMRVSFPGSDRRAFLREADRASLIFPPRLDDRMCLIRSAIRAGLAKGRSERADVAAQLNTSIRTLNRHVERTGQTFGSLRDDIRKQIALKYLSGTETPLSQIAHRIGFDCPGSSGADGNCNHAARLPAPSGLGPGW